MALTWPTLGIEVDFDANPTATYADILTSDGDVVSFWRFNSTSTFDDERGANDGTIGGAPSSTSGALPYDTDTALTFDGTDDNAKVPSSTALSTVSAMSVEVWLKLASLPGGTRDVASKRGAWLIQVNSSGKVIGTFKDDTSTGSVTSNTVLTTGVWHHVVLVYTNTAINLYIDGILDQTASYSSGMGLDGQPVRFAQTPSTSSSPAFQSVQTAAPVSSSITCNAPASITSGDFLLAQIQTRDTSSITAVPSGWVLLWSLSSTMYVYYKIATGSEPASYTWTAATAEEAAIAVSRWTGVDTVNLLHNQIYQSSGSAGTLSTGSHLPNVDNNLIVGLFWGWGSFPVNWPSYTGATLRWDRNCLNAFSGIGGASTTQGTASAATIVGTMNNGGSPTNWSIFLVLGSPTHSYLAASLDDAAVWSRALTAAEVAAHYEARLSGDGTWTALSASDTKAISINRGRQYELDRIEASTANGTVVDLDRELDPANQSSPHYPNVKPMRKIRVKLTHSAVDFPLLYGYVPRWPVRWQGHNYAEIGLSIVDGFDGLSQAQVTGSLATALSGAQIDAVLDKAYWPADKRNLDAGQYVMQGDDALTGTALELLRSIADSELGLVFLDASGNFTFHDRAHRGTNARSTTSQATFTEDGVGGTKYVDLSPSFDRDLIVNDWAVSPHPDVVGGAEQQAEDSESIASYWLRSRSRSTRLATNTYALAQANQLLNETAQPNLRFDEIEIAPRNDTEWQTVLDLEISDRVTVIRNPLPNAGGTTINRDFFVEGIGWSLAPRNMRVTLRLSPISSGDYYSTIVRDGPISYWRMDTTT